MGPKGHDVLIEKSSGACTLTRDSLLVVNNIIFKEKFQNFGANLIKKVANATHEAAGGGAAYGTILSREIFVEGCRLVEAGHDIGDLRRGMKLAIDIVIARLKSSARKLKKKDDIIKVATFFANGEREIGELIAEALEKVGNRGPLIIQGGKTFENNLEFVQSFHLNVGYISPYFCDEERIQNCEMNDPLVLIHEKKISSRNGIMKILEAALKEKRPLLIVAEDVEPEVLEILAVNKHLCEIEVCVIRVPDFGQERKSSLEDLAFITGSTVLTEHLDVYFDRLNLRALTRAFLRKYSVDFKELLSPYLEVFVDMLGSCKKVIISKHDSIILYGAAEKNARVERCKQISSQARLAKLIGDVAVVSIGGASEAEVNERKNMATDALNATKLAIEEGTVPGGGVSLLYAAIELNKVPTANIGERHGVQIIQNALKIPAHIIASNAGADGSAVVAKLLDQHNTSIGYNAITGEYVDMYETGVVDPLAVIIASLDSAASISSFINLDAVILRRQPTEE